MSSHYWSQSILRAFHRSVSIPRDPLSSHAGRDPALGSSVYVLFQTLRTRLGQLAVRVIGGLWPSLWLSLIRQPSQARHDIPCTRSMSQSVSTNLKYASLTSNSQLSRLPQREGLQMASIGTSYNIVSLHTPSIEQVISPIPSSFLGTKSSLT